MRRCAPFTWLTAAIVALLASQGGLAGELPAMAVMDLRARGVPEDTAKSLTQVVLKEVDRVGLFRVVGMEDIARLLEHSEHRLQLGCDDMACLSDVGGALGVEVLLAGSVGQVGEALLLSLQLIDVRRAVVLQRIEETVRGSPEALIERARSATRQVLQPLFDQAKGFLDVRCDREDAEVFVGDRLMGTTPLGPLAIAGGIHKVRVEKKRFISRAQEVTIRHGQVAVLEMNLVPSPEYAQEMTAIARRDRALAWTFTGLGAALAATAVGLFVWNGGQLTDLDRDQALYLEGRYAGTVQSLNERAREINLTDSLTWIPVGTAALSAGLALYFWIAGEAPDRWSEVPDESADAGWRIRPTATGLSLTF